MLHNIFYMAIARTLDRCILAEAYFETGKKIGVTSFSNLIRDTIKCNYDMQDFIQRIANFIHFCRIHCLFVLRSLCISCLHYIAAPKVSGLNVGMKMLREKIENSTIHFATNDDILVQIVITSDTYPERLAQSMLSELSCVFYDEQVREKTCNQKSQA